MRILATSQGFSAPENAETIAYARSKFDEVTLNPYGRIMTPEEVEAMWDGYDGIIAGVEKYSAEMLERAPASLKVISRFGVGYEAIDIDAAFRKGIRITITPNVNMDAVADLIVGDMLAIARNIPYLDNSLKAGKYPRIISRDLYGQTVGLVGFGAIGKAVAKRLYGFDCKFLAYDPHFDKETAAKYGVKEATLDEIFTQSDFISLNQPVLPETIGMLNEERLRSMKKTAYVVNAARCQLVNFEDLKKALREKWIAGAAMDAIEPFNMDDKELLSLDNVILSSHLGGHTYKCIHDMGVMAADGAYAVLHNIDTHLELKKSLY